jgi:hypothetical protein
LKIHRLLAMEAEVAGRLVRAEAVVSLVVPAVE